MDTRHQAILLVEDNPDDEALTLRALRHSRFAHEILVARDGPEALDMLFATGPRASHGPLQPRLILLDLKLPKLDGVEVLRRIRADPHTRLSPVVVLTSSRENRDLARCYALGANSYIRKPLDFSQFRDVVAQLGRYWLQLNEPPPPEIP